MYLQQNGEKLYFQDTGPALDMQDIETAEARLGFPLPPELKALYLSDNGGKPHRSRYNIARKLSTIYPLDRMGPGQSVLSVNERNRTEEWQPREYIVFGEVEPEWYLCTDSGGSVYEIEQLHMINWQNFKVAESLDELICHLGGNNASNDHETSSTRATIGCDQPKRIQEDIAAAEHLLGMELPAKLRSLYHKVGSTKGSSISLPESSASPELRGAVGRLLPLGPSEDGKSLVQNNKAARELGTIPHSYVQFAVGVTGGKTCLGPNGAIYQHVTNEVGTVKHTLQPLANSVEEFFLSLQGPGDPFDFSSRSKFELAGPDLSTTRIAEAEQRLGTTFPDQLRRLYLKTNGGKPSRDRFRTDEYYGNQDGELHLLELLPRDGKNSVVETYEQWNEQWKEEGWFEPGMVPISVDSEDVVLDEDGIVKILPHWDAGSLDQFLSSLRMEDE